MMKQNFIKTVDKETADKLMTCGFQLVSRMGDMYTFLNQPPKNFSFEEIDKNKYTYSNMINL